MRSILVCFALTATACGSVSKSDQPDGGPADLCPAPLSECDGTCTNTDVDSQNCGSCGNPCDPGEVCSGGSCQLTCQDGLISCDGTCVDPMRDRDYCGASEDCQDANAGEQCADGFVCDGSGSCALSCQDGLTECGGTCTDTQSDEQNCGGCAGDGGAVCADLCIQGTCRKASVGLLGPNGFATKLSPDLFSATPLDFANDADKIASFDILAIGRFSTVADKLTPEMISAIKAYSDAGGAIVTEWDGLSPLFTSYHTTYRYASTAPTPWAWFQGQVGAGDLLASGTEITMSAPDDPIAAGMPATFSSAGQTDFFYTTYGVDSGEIETLATFPGNGTTNFPDGDLAAVLRGVRCGGNIVMLVFDAQDGGDDDPALLKLINNALVNAVGPPSGNTTDVCPPP